MSAPAPVAEDQPIARPPSAPAPAILPVWPDAVHQGPRPDHKLTSDPGDASPIGHRTEPFIPHEETLSEGSFGVVPLP